MNDAGSDPTSTPSARRFAWLHWGIVLLVFSITGSLAVFLSRFLLQRVLGLEGGFWKGPWIYRIAYVALIPPSYSVMLVLVGTLLGKGRFFRARVVRVWGWALPKPIRRRLDPGKAVSDRKVSSRGGNVGGRTG
jgi:hypothetical protein